MEAEIHGTQPLGFEILCSAYVANAPAVCTRKFEINCTGRKVFASVGLQHPFWPLAVPGISDGDTPPNLLFVFLFL